MTKWPLSPVETGGCRCASPLLAAQVFVHRRSEERVAIAASGADGWFQVALSPGDYVIETRVEEMMCTPVDITVPSDRYVRVDIICDTGVR